MHDHWVDRLGNEVIEDFNRAEGDRIEVVGHTVDVYHLEHVDTNGDGILDASVLYIQSNQGNAGAHNKDQLGTITVFGDLVTRSDYTVDAQPPMESSTRSMNWMKLSHRGRALPSPTMVRRHRCQRPTMAAFRQMVCLAC